uniref:NB-ARC domain-containing protein n=1 Tax=Fagus sylvatica TaxID=28930 RepID=A0A2N9EX05_FAGSY
MGEQLSYCNSLDQKMQKLKRKLKDLSSREADVNKELEYAESISLKKRRQQVENWLKNVERIKSQVQSMEQALGERRLLGRVQLGKRVEELTGEVTQLVDQGNFPVGLTFEAHETKGDALLTTKLVGQTFQTNMDKIWTCLMQDEVLIIGLYGMGGVGKTTLNDIAKLVHLDLSNVDDEKKRAAKLAQALMRRQAIYVCRRMGCQVKIKVKPLSKEEAWCLFLEKVGHGIALPPEVKDIARSVTKECAGLPLAITVLAGSMRGVDDICEWRNALEILKASNVGQDDMENEVFQVLRFSYWSLNDSKVQQCFLYCSLYPEDYKIRREELIERFIDEGLIDRMKSRQAEFDRGHTILNKLENSCLLEGIIDYFPHEKKCVKMHDLVRDMALQIVIVSPRFMVEAGVGLKDIPDEEKWTEDLEKDSLSNLENLTSLLLRECDKIEHVPSLAKLTTLRSYLDLYAPNLKRLPVGTFAKLSRLQYLVVYRSSETSIVNGEEVASLKKLETFSGQFYEVHNFNAYVKSLQVGGPSNYLLQMGLDDPDLTPVESDTFDKRVILKRSYLSTSRGGEDPLLLPEDIEFLYIQECNDVRSLCGIPSLKNATNLKACVIKKCNGVEHVLSYYSSSSSILPLQSLESLRLAFLQNLSDLIRCDTAFSRSPPSGTLACLKEIRIYNCPNIKKLLMPGLLTCLQNLEEIHVEDCRQMVEIVAAASGEDEDEVEKNKEGLGTIMFTLPKLRCLQLWDLPQLKSICPGNAVLVCDSLQDIIVRYCRKLKRIPLSLPLVDGQPSPPPSLQIIKAFPNQWWESLEWDHPNAKNVLQPFCHFTRYV